MRAREHSILTVEPAHKHHPCLVWRVVVHRAPTRVERARALISGAPMRHERRVLPVTYQGRTPDEARDLALERHPDALLLDHVSRPGEPFEGRA